MICVLAWVEECHNALSRELGIVRQEARGPIQRSNFNKINIFYILDSYHFFQLSLQILLYTLYSTLFSKFFSPFFYAVFFALFSTQLSMFVSKFCNSSPHSFSKQSSKSSPNSPPNSSSNSSPCYSFSRPLGSRTPAEPHACEVPPRRHPVRQAEQSRHCHTCYIIYS